MIEAENQTNSSPESVNSVNLIAAEQVKPYSNNLPSETIVSVIVPASQIENQEVIDCVTLPNEFEASENGLAALAPSQRLLVSLIQALSSSNSNLGERVTQLEQTLTECLKALQSHKKYSRVTESMLTQKTQELVDVQEQIKCLSQEIGASHQTIQHQKTLIDNLTAQLQSNQERFAQMEWEHYLIQASYKEQSNRIVQTENICRELRTRLNRQQHYTLQLKVALERCLEPESSYQPEVNVDIISTRAKYEQGRSIQMQSFSKTDSIPPWSTQAQFLTDELEPGWEEISHLPDIQSECYQSSILDWSAEGSSTRVASKYTPTLKIDEPIPSEPVCVETFNQHHEAFSNKAQTLGKQDDAAVGGCDRSSFLLPAHSSNEDITEPEEAQWQALQSLLAMFEATKQVTESPELSIVSSPATSASQLNQSNLHHLPAPNAESVSPDKKTEIQVTPPQQKTSTPNSNWPSPLVYPSHPPKCRKSLAAIELPTFTKLGART